MGDLDVLGACFVKAPVISEVNRKGHEPWRISKDRHDLQKLATGAAVRAMRVFDRVRIFDELRLKRLLLVRMTILSTRPLDDDNQASAVKYFRDEIARWLDVDDADPRIRWVVKWERYRGKGERGVRVEFVSLLGHLLAEKEEIERQIAQIRGESGKLPT